MKALLSPYEVFIQAAKPRGPPAPEYFSRSAQSSPEQPTSPFRLFLQQVGASPFLTTFWSNSGPVFGWILGSLWGPNVAPKLVQNWFKNSLKSESFFVPVFLQFWLSFGAQNQLKRSQSGSGRWPRRGHPGPRRVFAHMHLDSIFIMFLEHQAS